MKIKIKNKLLLIFCCLMFVNANSQTLTTSEELLYKAMSDEMNRNKDELELNNQGKPFYIAYSYNKSSRLFISGSLGGLIANYYAPVSAMGTVELYLGDNKTTSDLQYRGNFGGYRVPIDADYDALRYHFWLASDISYKGALKARSVKESRLRNEVKTAEEAELNDFERLPSEVTAIYPDKNYEANKSEWEKNIKELSAEFKNYSELYNTLVKVETVSGVIYKISTDGVKIRQPYSYMKLTANASILAVDGSEITDSWGISKILPSEIPQLEEIKKQLKSFSETLIKLSKCEIIKEYYSGPVLMEGGACSSLFTANLIQDKGLLASRQPASGGVNSLILEFGKKVIDSRITIKNFTSLQEYNKTPLYGHYTIDAQGFPSKNDVTLIDKGIFAGLLNGRVPTVQAKTSTGSSRYGYSTFELNYYLAPGTIHISIDKGTKQEKMKDALIQAAKKANKNCAYIIRKFSGRSSHIFRVDLKSGAETMIRISDLSQLGLDVLNNVLEISSKENVSNYFHDGKIPCSLICPSSILLKNVELRSVKSPIQKIPDLVYPLKR